MVLVSTSTDTLQKKSIFPGKNAHKVFVDGQSSVMNWHFQSQGPITSCELTFATPNW